MPRVTSVVCHVSI